jgi:hypothetical protein
MIEFEIVSEAKESVFAHGQAYVAASRAGIPSETRILIEQQKGGQVTSSPYI